MEFYYKLPNRIRKSSKYTFLNDLLINRYNVNKDIFDNQSDAHGLERWLSS